MAEKKLEVSTVGKLITAVVIGLIGGGVGTMKLTNQDKNYYSLPEKTIETIDKIAERQIDFSNRIVKLEEKLVYVTKEVERNSKLIEQNADRNEKIIEDIKQIEKRLPYSVSFK